MTVSAISSMIAEAKLHEGRSGELEVELNAKLQTMHSSIKLPAANQSQYLLEIVEQYIDAIPELLTTMMHKSYSGGQLSSCYPSIVNMVRSFFTHQSVQEQETLGLDNLMHQAFMAHRFIEEVNDYYIMHLGLPVIETRHLATTVIVHELIGDAFANELDASIAEIVALMDKQNLLWLPSASQGPDVEEMVAS